MLAGMSWFWLWFKMHRGLSEISSTQPFPLPCRARVTPIFTGLFHVLFQGQEQGEGAGLGSCHKEPFSASGLSHQCCLPALLGPIAILGK